MTFRDRILRGTEGLLRFFKIGQISIDRYEEEQGIDPPADFASFQQLYAEHPWIYAGIYAIASSGAGVPLRLMKGQPSGKAVQVTGHPFMDLLNRPNDFMTGYDLIELMFIFLEATGESYWFLDDLSDGNGPNPGLKLANVKEIWPLPPQTVNPIPHHKDFLQGFRYEPQGGQALNLATQEVIYLRYANPLSLYRGQGSISAAKKTVVGDLFATSWNNTFFKNHALPAAFLKTDQELTDPQRARMKAGWAKMYQGVASSHKVALLENGLDLAVTSTSRKDMEFAVLQEAAMKRILGPLGVPLIMVSIGDEQSYNNAHVQERVFWRNTMSPKFKKVAAMLTLILHSFGEDKSLFVEFDTSGVEALKPDQKVAADTARVWYDMGVPVNDLIETYGAPLEAVEGGDVGLVDFNKVPITMVGELADPEEPEPIPDEEEDSERTIRVRAIQEKRRDYIYWKRFIAVQEPIFRSMRRELRRLFDDQERRVLEKIAENLIPGRMVRAPFPVDLLLFDVKAEAAEWEAKVGPFIERTYQKLGSSTLEDLGVAIAFDVNNPKAVEFLSERTFRFSFQTNDTTQRRLAKKLAGGLDAGATQKELSDIVQEEFRFAKRFRSERIARTEIGTAANKGIQDGMEQGGAKFKKWLQSHDANVRDSHRTDQVVGIDEPFEVGGFFLDYPGDPSAPVGEIVNCRCTMRAIRS